MCSVQEGPGSGAVEHTRPSFGRRLVFLAAYTCSRTEPVVVANQVTPLLGRAIDMRLTATIYAVSGDGFRRTRG